jgi:transporter family-2 protein
LETVYYRVRMSEPERSCPSSNDFSTNSKIFVHGFRFLISNPSMAILWVLIAAGAGACISIQAAVNGSLRTHLSDARWATFFSICGTITTALIVMLALRPTPPPSAAFRSAPWWSWIGGPLGALIVFSGALLTPKMGAASFIAAIIGGQIACSMCLDHFSLLNLPPHPMNSARLIGAVLVFGGVLLVTRN